jgi:hypothetical protein
MPVLLFFLTFAMTPSDTLSQAGMQELLPASLRGWEVSEAAHFYSGREIFHYMDGAGEVYLAYGFKRLLAQRYARPNQEEILVEIFDMGLPRGAFGAFTNMAGRGPTVDIGQGGEFKTGLLSFWKGRYFVCVMVDRENEEASQAILDLGRSISARIKEQGAKPDILRLLPDGSYASSTLRYFFRNEILNIHYYVADANLFHLHDRTDAVLVRMTNDKSYLLLIQYPTSEEADSAVTDFSQRYLPEARGKGVVQTENKKWSGCIRQNNFLVVVFDGGTQAQALNLLETVRRRLP